MIGRVALKKALGAQVLNDKKLQKQFDQEAFKKFNTAKAIMLRELDNHAITKDLQGSGDSGLVPRGTLFGFLGFMEGEDPVGPLRDLLETKCTMTFFKNQTNSVTRTYVAQVPNKEELYAATPLPWASGRSWLKGIEQGLSGMGNYIDSDSDYSRSGEGLQTENANLGGRLKNTSYRSTILNNFKKRLISGGFLFQ